MEKAKPFFEKWQNPALWLTIVASLWWFSQEMGMVRVNEGQVKILHSRITTEGETNDEQADRLYQLEINHLKGEIDFQKEKLEIINLIHELENKVKENTIRLEPLNKKR